MFDKNILILIIPLILVVAISGVPVDDTSNEPKGTIVLKVPPAEKDATPRPVLIVYPNEKTTTTTAAPPTSPTPKSTGTVAPTKDKENDTPKPNSTTVAPTSTTESTVLKDNTPRPMLVIYSVGKPNSTTVEPTTSTTESTVPKDNTPRPMLVIYSVGKPNSTTVEPTTSTTESTVPKDNTPRPMLIIYSINNTTTTTAQSTTTTDPSTSTTAPSTTNADPSTSTTAPSKNDTSRPIMWINSDVSPSSDATVKRPENFLRGYNCPMRKGFFQYPDKCDVYIECKDYIPLTYICPEGLQFNPNAKKQEHVCDHPSVVKCKPGIEAAKESEKEPTTGVPSNVLRSYTCPKRRGFFRYPGKCDVYILCENYAPLTYICPDGLYFNPNARRPEHVCDDPSVVKCEYIDTRPSEVRPVTRPTPGTARQPWSNMHDFSCPSPYGYFKFSEQCDEYVECRAFTPMRYICPDGLHFKTDALWTENPCVHPWLSRCALY